MRSKAGIREGGNKELDDGSVLQSAQDGLSGSDTHQLHLAEMMGFAGSTHPTRCLI